MKTKTEQPAPNLPEYNRRQKKAAPDWVRLFIAAF